MDGSALSLARGAIAFGRPLVASALASSATLDRSSSR